MSVSNPDSYSSLHKFLTVVVSFIRKEQQFADKDIQNSVFTTLRTQASLSSISDTLDFDDALRSLYDLVYKILYFRNQEDDQKLVRFVSSLIDCISRSKNLSHEASVDDLLLFATQSFFKSIATDGIADLDPRWALLLLKLAWVLPPAFKFSSPVGRGKISNDTTFDSGNTWLYLEINNHAVLSYENIDHVSHKLATQTLNMQNVALWEGRAKTSSRFVLDHHHRYCQSTSITHMLYVLLVALQKLSSTDSVLQRFVAFIDMSDDMYYQLATMDDRVSLWSLVGVQRELLYKKLINIDDIYALFQNQPSLTGLEVLTDHHLDFLSHGQWTLCKSVIQNKANELHAWNIKFLALKDAHTFYHYKSPFLWLIADTIPRVLDITSKYSYGLLQLNQKTGEIKIHNMLWFDQIFLASLTHPAIKVMKGRNIFIKANEDIADDIIALCLTDLWCPDVLVQAMIQARTNILKNQKT